MTIFRILYAISYTGNTQAQPFHRLTLKCYDESGTAWLQIIAVYADWLKKAFQSHGAEVLQLSNAQTTYGTTHDTDIMLTKKLLLYGKNFQFQKIFYKENYYYRVQTCVRTIE
jgi:hypothetical protein